MTKKYSKIERYIKIIITSAVMLMLSIGLSAIEVNAKQTYTEGALEYVIDNNSITITGYFGKENTVTIPSSIGGIPVNTIGKNAFVGTNATTVNLPSSVITVEQGAFSAGTVVVNNYGGDNTERHEAGDGGNGSGSGTDYTKVNPDDEVIIGDIHLKLINKEKGVVHFQDEEGRAYHSNGGYIIEDKTNKQLKGDITILSKEGMEEEIAEVDLEGKEEAEGREDVKGVNPIVIVVVIIAIVCIAIGVIAICRKSSKRKE